jgi:hypothetical protein
VIVIVAIGAMLLTIGVAAAIVVHKSAEQKGAETSPVVLASDPEMAESEASGASSAEVVTDGSDEGGMAAAPEVAVPEADDAPPAFVSAATAQAAAGNSPDDLQSRVKVLLRSMTPQERREMVRQMAAMDQRWAENRAKFALPSQQKLQNVMGSIQMSDGQRQQLKLATRALRPQLTQALLVYYDRQSQLSNQLQALNDAGLGAQAEPLHQALNEVQTQINTVRDSFDQQYRQVISGILTPDQLKAAGLGQ